MLSCCRIKRKWGETNIISTHGLVVTHTELVLAWPYLSSSPSPHCFHRIDDSWTQCPFLFHLPREDAGTYHSDHIHVLMLGLHMCADARTTCVCWCWDHTCVLMLGTHVCADARTTHICIHFDPQHCSVCLRNLYQWHPLCISFSVCIFYPTLCPWDSCSVGPLLVHWKVVAWCVDPISSWILRCSHLSWLK